MSETKRGELIAKISIDPQKLESIRTMLTETGQGLAIATRRVAEQQSALDRINAELRDHYDDMVTIWGSDSGEAGSAFAAWQIATIATEALAAAADSGKNPDHGKAKS